MVGFYRLDVELFVEGTQFMLIVSFHVSKIGLFLLLLEYQSRIDEFLMANRFEVLIEVFIIW